MKTVIFTLEKKDKTLVSLEYKPFDLSHSELWLKSLKSAESLGMKILGEDRVYNFLSKQEQLRLAIKGCNQVIEDINKVKNYSIPLIDESDLQNSVNYIHRFFVDAELNGDFNRCVPLWNNLNFYLHGIEIIMRSPYLQGQVYVELAEKDLFDLPNESYDYFTVKKTYGYCYANYAHIGRHLLEAYNARDEHAPNEHILPMSKISGSSYLWLGSTSSDEAVSKKMKDIEKWFVDNNLESSVNMSWGDKRLAIGWLPVAELITDISPEDLIGLSKIVSVKINALVAQ